MATPQGFLDISETDSPPDSVDEPGVADILSSVKPANSNRPQTVKMGSIPVAAGSSVQLVGVDPSRCRVGVGVAALASGVTLSTLAYVSDQVMDGSQAGGLRYLAGVQIPVINSGSDFLIFETTSELYVTVPGTATAPVYISFFTESYSNA